MTERSDEWWSDEFENLLMLGRWPEGIMKQLCDNYRRVRKVVNRNIRKEKKELRKRKVKKIQE